MIKGVVRTRHVENFKDDGPHIQGALNSVSVSLGEFQEYNFINALA